MIRFNVYRNDDLGQNLSSRADSIDSQRVLGSVQTTSRSARLSHFLTQGTNRSIVVIGAVRVNSPLFSCTPFSLITCLEVHNFRRSEPLFTLLKATFSRSCFLTMKKDFSLVFAVLHVFEKRYHSKRHVVQSIFPASLSLSVSLLKCCSNSFRRNVSMDLTQMSLKCSEFQIFLQFNISKSPDTCILSDRMHLSSSCNMAHARHFTTAKTPEAFPAFSSSLLH